MKTCITKSEGRVIGGVNVQVQVEVQAEVLVEVTVRGNGAACMLEVHIREVVY